MKAEIVYSERSKQYRFRFVAGNGQILAVSETYRRERKARASAEKLMKAIRDFGMTVTWRSR